MALIGAQGLILNELPAFSADKIGSGAVLRRRWRGRFDEDLVCIISDLHVNPEGYQPAKLERTIDEILRHLRANGESIKFEPKNLRSVRYGRTKFNRLVGNDGFIFAMGEKMYAELYRQIQDDAGLKPRFVQ